MINFGQYFGIQYKYIYINIKFNNGIQCQIVNDYVFINVIN